MANDHLMTILGMLCVGMAEFLHSTEDTISKLSLNLNGSQMLFATDLVQIPIAIIWWNILRYRNKTKEYGPWYGKKEYRKPLWFYGFFIFMEYMTIWYGIRSVPIGNAYCILAFADLITIFIAWIYLNEELLKMFIPALIIKTISILFIIQQPEFIFEYFNSAKGNDINNNNQLNQVRAMDIFGLILMIVATFTYCGSGLMVRLTVKKNDDDDDTEVEGVHFLQFHLVDSFECILVFVPFTMIINTLSIRDPFIGNIDNLNNEWKYDTQSLLSLFVLGMVDVSAGILKVIGYQLGDATKVVWFENVDLLSSYVFQVFVFGNIPNKFEIIGISLSVVVLGLTLGEEIYTYFYYKQRNGVPYQRILQTDSNDDTQSNLDVSDVEIIGLL